MSDVRAILLSREQRDAVQFAITGWRDDAFAFDKLVEDFDAAGDQSRIRCRITHGRHCTCSPCAREDWTQTGLAPCGMHGRGCPNVYQPWGPAGREVDAIVCPLPEQP